ncbi:hypothetical protein [Streptomyces sp. ISL-11]|uniref:hypothetical protein n=1 Tax=Streptomyces sp. ISL-11 TaxID=2819174 RepID=UPI002034A997|nr:hypothetical protein [Streptomyces sp. ISL-11]
MLLLVPALGLLLALLPAPPARAADAPTVTLDRRKAGKGGRVTVTGTGWRPGTLLTLLICGQNMIGGTNTCANADGRTVTTDTKGAFRRELPVAEPPKPCPCVVHVATVTEEAEAADAAFTVAGHPVEPLPSRGGEERLGVLGTRLDGAGGVLTWFGAPPKRRLVVTVGNLGSAPAKDPVFHLGTAHGVLAPSWEERPWRGTIAAGQRARVALDVELPAGAYGDYTVSLKYGDKVLLAEPWDVSRPWGVTLFWILLCVVVPVGLYRAGMAVVDRFRPRTGSTAPVRRRARTAAARTPAARTPANRTPAARTEPSASGEGGGTLPWFTPDAMPATRREDPGEPGPG